MLFQKLEHMIEKTDSGVDVSLTRAVKREFEPDLRLFRISFHRRGASTL
jgi:hypothetical protein